MGLHPRPGINSPWQARVFAPAAKLESLIRGETVETIDVKPSSGK